MKSIIESLQSLDFDKSDTIRTLMKELSHEEIIHEVQNEYKEESMDKIYKLVKFFEKKTKLSNILNFIIKYKDVEEHVSISSSKMIIHFFVVVLNYYSINNFDLNYNDNNIDKDTKIKIIEKALSLNNGEKSIKIFNLIDFMFNEIKNILMYIKNGFWILNECVNEDFVNKKKCGDLQIKNNLYYEKTIFTELDILFYIIFMFIFPKELKIKLKEELRITDCEYNILEKCKGLIIKDQSICIVQKDICNLSANLLSPNSSNSNANSPKSPSFFSKFKKEDDRSDRIELKSVSGILMLLSIFAKLRPFNNRRKSKF
jgi:Fe2+ or Zn2+ uptake regulation protein